MHEKVLEKNEKLLKRGESGLQWRQVVRSGEKWHIVEANGVLRLRERVPDVIRRV